MDERRTAAALIIGNELLTGKVRDTNVQVLAKELFCLGVSLRKVVMCSDEHDEIVADLDLLRSRYDFVFTSGGIGPTHDDVTMRAVAEVFSQPLAPSTELSNLLREYFGEACSERHLKMAEVPRSATLVGSSGSAWPAIRVANVFVLPGLPEVFSRKILLLREQLGSDRPFISRSVGSRLDENELVAPLEEVDREFPQVSIGSYPRWGEGSLRVVVTFDGTEPAQVDGARAAFMARFPSHELFDVECLSPEDSGPAVFDGNFSRGDE